MIEFWNFFVEILFKNICSYESSKNVERIKNLYGDDLIKGRRGIECVFWFIKILF